MEELSTSFTEIIDLIKCKSSHFLEKYNQQLEEILKLKKELAEKNFEDNNYNKVSMLRTQSKEITELKHHIELLEKRNTSLKDKNQLLEKEVNDYKSKEKQKKVKKPRKNAKPKSNNKNKKTNSEPQPVPEPENESEPQPVPEPKSKSNNNDIKLVISIDNSKDNSKDNFKDNSKKSKNNKDNKEEELINEIPNKTPNETPDEIPNETPDEIPDINDMDVFEHKGIEYYYSTKSYYIYEIANDDGDIGERLGIYKLNGTLLLEAGEGEGLEVLELEEGEVALLDFF